MPESRFTTEMTGGVPIVTAPPDIDIITVDELRAVLLDAGGRGHATVVVDMTRTVFCDSAGLGLLVGAHRRALAKGGELRLVVAAEGAVARVLAVTALDRVIPSFGSLGQALAVRS
jgi:anti-sigma B factor antagonist